MREGGCRWERGAEVSIRPLVCCGAGDGLGRGDGWSVEGIVGCCGWGFCVIGQRSCGNF